MNGKRTVSKKAVVIWFVMVVVLFCAALAFFFGYYARGKAIGEMTQSLKLEKANNAIVVKDLEACKETIGKQRQTADEATKKLEACEKAVKKPQQAVKKPQQKIIKRQVVKPSTVATKEVLPVAKQPVMVIEKASPIEKQVVPPVVERIIPPFVPAPIPAPRLLTLRLNVVEWSGASGELFSRNIGPAIRKGMANGSVKRTSVPAVFRIIWKQGAERLAGKAIWINGESRILPLNFSPNYPVEVTAKNGLATIEMPPEMIGQETMICVWPSVGNGAKFISPPQNSVGGQLPLITTPGELEYQVKNGVQDVFMHFVVKK